MIRWLFQYGWGILPGTSQVFADNMVFQDRWRYQAGCNASHSSQVSIHQRVQDKMDGYYREGGF